MTSTDTPPPHGDFTTLLGCGGSPGGGGGPGGGGAGPTTPCPDYECPDPEPEPEYTLQTDMLRDTIPPASCSDPSNTHWEQIFCRSAIDSTQARKTLQALDRIATRGAECAILAQKGREMLSNGTLRFFTWAPGDDAAYGHPNTGIQVGHLVVARYDPLRADQDFEHILVHELDHVFRRQHLPGSTWDTPNTAVCG